MKSETILGACKLLSDFIENFRINDNSIYGPSPGIGINGRFYRAINNISALFGLPYIKKIKTPTSHAYNILMNMELYKTTGEKKFLDRVNKSLIWLSNNQIEGSYWVSNAPGWRKNTVGAIGSSTVSLSLFKSYDLFRKEKYVKKALAYCDFILDSKFYTFTKGGNISFNYLVDESIHKFVTNATTVVLSVLGHAYKHTKNMKYIENTPKIIGFLKEHQLPSGEFIYNIFREHYRCPQYNGFQFLDLYEYYSSTKDENILPLMKNLARYLNTKVNRNGSVPFGCLKNLPFIYYHSSVVGAALSKAYEMFGRREYKIKAIRTAEYVISKQKKDGSFPYGKRALFGILNDKITYPRQMGYIGYHLMIIRCLVL